MERSDTFGGKAIARFLCHFEWKIDQESSALEHQLALVDSFLPMKLSVGQKDGTGKVPAYITHHEMFLL